MYTSTDTSAYPIELIFDTFDVGSKRCGGRAKRAHSVTLFPKKNIRF